MLSIHIRAFFFFFFFFFFFCLFVCSHSLALAISLGDIFTSVYNKILVPVVVTTREIAVENILGALGVTDLRIDGGAGHMRNHGVTTAPGALHVTERVVLGSGLREPNVTTVASQVA